MQSIETLKYKVMCIYVREVKERHRRQFRFSWATKQLWKHIKIHKRKITVLHLL